MMPAASHTVSRIVPSIMRPVLDRRATRPASSSFVLRKRSRNDMRRLRFYGYDSRVASAAFDFRNARKDSVASNPVVIVAEDLVVARQAKLVVGKRQSAGCCVICRGVQRNFANYHPR